MRLCRSCLRRGSLRPLGAAAGLYRALAGLAVADADLLPDWICERCFACLCKFRSFRERSERSRGILLARIGDLDDADQIDENLLKNDPEESTLAISNTVILDITYSKTHKRHAVECSSVSRNAIADKNHCGETIVFPDLKEEFLKEEDYLSKGSDSEEIINGDESALSSRVKLEKVCDNTFEILIEGADDELNIESKDDRDESAGRRREAKEVGEKKRLGDTNDEDGDRERFEFDDDDDDTSSVDTPIKIKKIKKVKESKHKKRKLNKTLKSNMKKKIKKTEFSSRMVLETEQYKVIKLSREQLLNEMLANEKSDRYLNAPYKCHLCVKGFNYEDVLQNHMTKHEPKNGLIECDLCHQFLPSAVSMRGHKKSHSTKYQCKRCGVVKASRQHLLEHFMLIHEGAPRTYVCNICGKTLTKRTMFQKHMRIHYPSNKITCDKCGKLFKTIETLRAHMLRHDDIKRYSCDQCAKTFRYASLLYTHKVTHIKTKDFYCVECDMRFKTEANLRLHLRKSLKHIDPDLLKFRCDQCDRRYDDLKGLQHHVEWVHLRLKNFKCAKCDMQFGSQDGLRSHMKKIHDGIRPPRTHICEICNKAFRAKAVLIKHIRVHTGERPYECNECGKKFAQNSTMSTHIKLVHLKMQRHVNRKKSSNNPIIKKDSPEQAPVNSIYHEPPIAEHNSYYYPSGSGAPNMRQLPIMPVFKFNNDE